MLLTEIIGVGDELLYGETNDTNTSDIARSLQPYKVAVRRTLRVADDLEVLAAEVRSAWNSARLTVLSGGLGPTPDDVTREAVALALGEEMSLDPEKLAWLEALFAGRGWKMPEANRKQAMKIPSAVWLENPRGTAPGWWISRDGKDLVCLPGPPGEWKPMWAEVLPKLNLPSEPYAQVTYKTFGLGESRIVELLGDLFRREGDVEVGTYAKMDGVHVVVRGEPTGVERFAAQIKPLIAEFVWGEGSETLPQGVLRLLEARGATLSTLESMTGGLLGQLLTSAAGASRVYAGGLIGYGGGVKAKLVSGEAGQGGFITATFAEAMAEQTRANLETTYALSTTGVAGPDELEGQPVGTVYIGLATPGGVKHKHVRLPGANREMLRGRAAHAALAFLVSELRGEG
ncbi:MAG: nicotinamide-nucleotide amidohydrolase family protein [Meiothermus sp.]|nr:nicotinamide-nucleotide amidohydrolase family protein [Meiothermus sp.]